MHLVKMGSIREIESAERIHAEPARAWTVAALAREVGLSRAAFARRFAHAVGVPPRTYLTNWRMAIAGRLLHETDLKFAAVAGRVGYESDPVQLPSGR